MAQKIGTLFDNDVMDGEDGPYVIGLDGEPIFLSNQQLARITPISKTAGPLQSDKAEAIPGMFERVFSGAEPDLKSDTPFFDLARQARINKQSFRSLNRGEPFVDARTARIQPEDPGENAGMAGPIAMPDGRKRVMYENKRTGEMKPVLTKGKPNVFAEQPKMPQQKSYNSFAEFFGK
jgi:hypothetical protein